MIFCVCVRACNCPFAREISLPGIGCAKGFACAVSFDFAVIVSVMCVYEQDEEKVCTDPTALG